jgi:hypothetical protein
MGRTIEVQAQELPADEAAARWERIVSRSPSDERCGRATSRPIPIVRVVPAAEAGQRR